MTLSPDGDAAFSSGTYPSAAPGHQNFYGTGSAALSALKAIQDDLNIRSEVSDALQSMLSDIETAQTLSCELNHYNALEAISLRLDTTRAALDEERAMREESELRWTTESKRRVVLADQFVVELLQLSTKLDDLEQWKVKNEKIVKGYGDLEKKLEKTEEVLQQLKESGVAQSEAGEETRAGTVEEVQAGAAKPAEMTRDEILAAEEERELQAALEASLVEAEAHKLREAQERETKTAKDEEQKENEKELLVNDDGEEREKTRSVGEADSANAENQPRVEKIQETAPESKTTQQAEQQTAEKPDLGADSEVEKEPPSFASLQESDLMRVFGCLDAFDILSTAQVNVALYSRVDTLFGLGGNAVGESKTRAKHSEETKNDDIKEKGKTESALSASRAVKTDSSTANASRDQNTSTMRTVLPVQPAPTRVILPPASVPPVPTPTPISVPAQASAALTTAPSSAPAPAITPAPRGGVGGGLTTMFSQLRSKAQQKVAPLQQAAPTSPAEGESMTPASTATSTLAVTTGPVQNGMAAPPGDAPIGLNAAMATSMASKLTAVELSVIISMQNKLRKRDNQFSHLRAEKDDLGARLQGVESVKDFLISKVSDVEKKHKEGQDEIAKIMRQVASDQEVIAFLDSRVQELERSLRNMEESRTKSNKELQRLRAQGGQKVQVLSDMLQFEREQLAESEQEWKAQKKVLVKEVKSCRSQIVALQAERDGYYEQNRKLKDALHGMNGLVRVSGIDKRC